MFNVVLNTPLAEFIKEKLPSLQFGNCNLFRNTVPLEIYAKFELVLKRFILLLLVYQARVKACMLTFYQKEKLPPVFVLWSSSEKFGKSYRKTPMTDTFVKPATSTRPTTSIKTKKCLSCFPEQHSKLSNYQMWPTWGILYNVDVLYGKQLRLLLFLGKLWSPIVVCKWGKMLLE